MNNVKLIPDKYYHIYNRGVNGTNLFHDTLSYAYFYNLLEKYIKPVAYIYAWVLMPNHFHLLIKIKKELMYKYTEGNTDFSPKVFKDIKWQTVEWSESADLNLTGRSDKLMGERMHLKLPNNHFHFSHSFNSYTRYHNKRFNREGRLFEKSFKKKLITNKNNLKQVLLYIHNNPVHHGFCEHAMDYPWSSYLTYVSVGNKEIENKDAIGWFDDEANFRNMHNQRLKY